MEKPTFARMSCIVVVFCAAAAISSVAATTFATLKSFNGSNGANPLVMSLVQGLDGNFYGTADLGGANGLGTVFKITPSGRLTTLYNFCSQTNCTDGDDPGGGLVLATDGNFFGTTYAGGANGGGTVFKITSSGTLTTLYSFCSQTDCADGARPVAGLVQGTDGNFYGTTTFGGANCPNADCGTVFKITPSGALTTLYSFCSQPGCTDGIFPYSAGLVQAANGSFYGTTEFDGANGHGTVFKITPSGTFTTLYSFCSQTNCTDGIFPVGGLVQATNGNFYGITSAGGNNGCYPNGGCGTVFKITPSGTLTTLYIFCSQPNCTDGYLPFTGLVQATNGSFYGTTSFGGANSGCNTNPPGCGTVFKITPSGTLTTLYSFCSQTNCTDGYDPVGGLVQATNGNFYGTTYVGGTSSNCSGGCGTVFSLSVGLRPFVEALPYSGKPGATIKFLGQGLTGTTSVLFSGTTTSASFTVKSDTYLVATIPSGAKTGFVKVTTPGGTLTSNKKFRVTP